MDKPNGSPLSGAEEQFSLQEIIDIGERAARALNDPIWALASKIASDTIMMEWTSTQPKETQKREHLWNQLQALGQIQSVMVSFVARAEQVVAEKQDPRQEHMDQQGFGPAPGTYQ